MTKTLAQIARDDCYTRIALAAREGRGVHLTPDECWIMANDTGIITVAQIECAKHGIFLDVNLTTRPLLDTDGSPGS